jgi:hypothetical protein
LGYFNLSLCFGPVFKKSVPNNLWIPGFEKFKELVVFMKELAVLGYRLL